MIKKIIKTLAYKLYSIGYFENIRLNNVERDRKLNSVATLGKNVWIDEQASVINNSGGREEIAIGENSRIMGRLFTFHVGGKIEVGRDCFIGPDTRIWSAKKVKIGDRVLIAHNVNIHDNISHPIDAKERHNEFVNFSNTGINHDVDIKADEIVIGDDVWIGFNVIILRGVHIGRGAIIGAGSVVTKNIEPWTVNVGNPIRRVNTLVPPEKF